MGTTTYIKESAMRTKIVVVSAVLLCGLVVAGVAWAMSSANYAIEWDVIGGGGGPMSSASYALNGTVGQGAIGAKSSASYRLGSGYWYGVAAAYNIFLPIIMKNYMP